MISFKAIADRARKLQTSEINIAREYLQHLFLRSFYRQKGSEKILFKGGTALRVVFQSPRFSEDLDFLGATRGYHSFEMALKGALVEIEREKIGINLTEAKPTVGGYLAIFSSKVGELNINVQLELSLRNKMSIEAQSVLVKSPLLPSYIGLILSENLLTTEKIQTVRTRSQPRDFFDLYFLLLLLRSNSKFDKSWLPEKGEVLQLIEERLEVTDVEGKLKPLLPRSFWPILGDFKGNLTREVERVFR